jgi:hypothetical protein
MIPSSPTSIDAQEREEGAQQRWIEKQAALREALPQRLRELDVCESGCEGRCRECPQDVANDAANEIQTLRPANAALLAAAKKFLKPYEGLSDERLGKIAKNRADLTFIYGQPTWIPPYLAASILEIREAVRLAEGEA